MLKQRLLWEAFKVLGVFSIWFFITRACQPPPEPGEIVSRGLKPNEQEKITIKPGRIEHHKKLGDGRIERKTAYRPPEAKTEVVIDNDRQVSVTSRRWGPCFSPGIGFSVGSVGIERCVLLDVKLFYYSHWGFVAGVPVTKFTRGWEGPYAAVSYNVYKGTGLFLGYAPLGARPIAGLRVSF